VVVKEEAKRLKLEDFVGGGWKGKGKRREKEQTTG